LGRAGWDGVPADREERSSGPSAGGAWGGCVVVRSLRPGAVGPPLPGGAQLGAGVMAGAAEVAVGVVAVVADARVQAEPAGAGRP
jgi:hypothetical protein